MTYNTWLHELDGRVGLLCLERFVALRCDRAHYALGHYCCRTARSQGTRSRLTRNMRMQRAMCTTGRHMRICGGKDLYNAFVSLSSGTPLVLDRSIVQVDSEFSAMLLTIC